MIDDELQLQREMNRAAKASELFRNEIFEESFDILLDQYKAEWAATAPSDTASRERLYYLTQAVDAIRAFGRHGFVHSPGIAIDELVPDVGPRRKGTGPIPHAAV